MHPSKYFFSEFTIVHRAWRQGDPISSYIFILCVEIMALMIRNNKNIKGITLANYEYKLMQFADDTAITLDGTESSLRCTLDLLDQFSKFSGLKPNIEKTEAIWIGSETCSKEILCNDIDLNWNHDTFTVLGIKFNTCLKDMIHLNYTDKILEISKLIKQWSKRKLTVMGRITVIKSLAISKIVHLLLSIPNPDVNMMKKLNVMFYKYIWNGSTDRIARNSLIQDV